jgi:hypothetical protein
MAMLARRRYIGMAGLLMGWECVTGAQRQMLAAQGVEGKMPEGRITQHD